MAADVEKFEGFLGAGARGDVAGFLLGKIEGGRGDMVHVSKLFRNDQSVVADEGAACGAYSFLAVGC